MAKRSRNSSETTIENRLKQGRGQGREANYNPWLHIQYVPSQGLASRIKVWKTGKVHHLLSELVTIHLGIVGIGAVAIHHKLAEKSWSC